MPAAETTRAPVKKSEVMRTKPFARARNQNIYSGTSSVAKVDEIGAIKTTQDLSEEANFDIEAYALNNIEDQLISLLSNQSTIFIVDIDIEIDAYGSILNIEIQQREQIKNLDAVLLKIKELVFLPALKNGLPVNSSKHISLNIPIPS